MSIINEALKKTEQDIQKISAKEQKVITSKFNFKSLLLYCLILGAGLFLTNFIFSLISLKIKTPQPQTKTAPLPREQPVQPVPAIPVLPVEVKNLTETKYVLNGIFYSDNNGYALVNNQIIREGDTVDGAKVVKITEKSVELNNQENIITLTTQR